MQLSKIYPDEPALGAARMTADGTQRVRISDIAEELGVSTATVSNVIHGKTKKISDETVKRVQRLLEERQYIPSMAGILLAQNDSRIIGVVVNDHEKYEGHVLEDGFISAAINALSREIDRAGYFMMVKVTDRWNEISKFGSMWNMEGLVLMGFCGQDYVELREHMRIPFVVYDGFLDGTDRLVNIEADNRSGGIMAGRYLAEKGHRRVLCIADNAICMDEERFLGLKEAIPEAERMLIPMKKADRLVFYRENLEKIRSYTAVFAVSDYYGAELVCFLEAQGISVPGEISVMGFDDSLQAVQVQPSLTTIRQDGQMRAQMALKLLKEMKEKGTGEGNYVLPISLVERESVAALP